MKEIKAIIQPFRLDNVLMALHEIPGLPGVTVSECRAVHVEDDGRYVEVRKNRIEILVEDGEVASVVEAIHAAAHTGHYGDGRIWITGVDDSLLIRGPVGGAGP